MAVYSLLCTFDNVFKLWDLGFFMTTLHWCAFVMNWYLSVRTYISHRKNDVDFPGLCM